MLLEAKLKEGKCRRSTAGDCKIAHITKKSVLTNIWATVKIRAMAGEIFYPFAGSQITILVITATVKPGQQEAVQGNMCLLRATSAGRWWCPANPWDHRLSP